MAIERLSFPEYVHSFTGVPIDFEKDPDAYVEELFEKYRDQTRLLTANRYPLTPRFWKNPSHRYSLVVNEDGSGIYMVAPTGNENGGTIMGLYTAGSIAGEEVLQGTIIRIPDKQQKIALTGRVNDYNLGPRVFELLRYVPGPSPRIALPSRLG